MIDVTQVLVTAAVSAILPSVLAAAFYKLIQRRDVEFDGIKSRVQQLEDEKIKGIQERLKDGSAEFDELHEGMKGFISRPDHYLHMERCDAKFAMFETKLTAQEKHMHELAVEVGGVNRIVTLIAAHMHIKIN